MGNIQHLQSYDRAMQAMKDNIRKIMTSSDTRQSKSDRIKQLLLHPTNDPTTASAIIDCAMESVQMAKSRVNSSVANSPSNQTH